MIQLFEIFFNDYTPETSFRRLNIGDRFELTDQVALVTDGIISVEILSEEQDAEPVTSMIAQDQDFLNLESSMGLTNPNSCNYIVETDTADIAVIDSKKLIGLLGEDSIKDAVIHYLFKSLCNTTETASYLSHKQSETKVRWALNRLEKTGKPVQVSQERIASFVGANKRTVTRSIRALELQGHMPKRNSKLLRKRGRQ